MPRRFRLIQVDVEAIQITNADSISRAILWAGGIESDGALYIPTASDILRVEPGEYIIKDSLGVFSKMTEKEFKKKYELI